MTREEERSPPSARGECWESATVSDIERSRRGTTCSALYHGNVSPVRSATAFNDWIVSTHQACSECCLPIWEFPHHCCGA
jgi:hypothetical protein